MWFITELVFFFFLGKIERERGPRKVRLIQSVWKLKVLFWRSVMFREDRVKFWHVEGFEAGTFNSCFVWTCLGRVGLLWVRDLSVFLTSCLCGEGWLNGRDGDGLGLDGFWWSIFGIFKLYCILLLSNNQTYRRVLFFIFYFPLPIRYLGSQDRHSTLGLEYSPKAIGEVWKVHFTQSLSYI